MHTFLANLSLHSWRVDVPAERSNVPERIFTRYGELPSALASFMKSFSRCLAPSEDAWFVSWDDLSRTVPDEEFRFDAFESLSLDAASEDPAWLKSIRSFWDQHFPFYLAVNGEYQYFAVALAGAERGCVVYGHEPEFESCTIVSRSLPDFLAMFSSALESSLPTYPFNCAIPRNAP